MKYDLEALKAEYIRSDLKMYSFEKTHGVRKDSLRKIAKRDKWDEAREKYREEVRRNQIQNAAELKSLQDEAWDVCCKKAKDLLVKFMGDIERNPKECGVTYPALIKAMKDLRDMGAFGMTQSEIKTMVEIDKLRKEIEGQAADKSINVVIHGVEEYGN